MSYEILIITHSQAHVRDTDSKDAGDHILLAATVVFLAARVFQRQKSDVMIENNENQPNRNVFLMLLLCMISTLVILFILSRFGLSIAYLAQKFLAFLPFMRGLLPF